MDDQSQDLMQLFVNKLAKEQAGHVTASTEAGNKGVECLLISIAGAETSTFVYPPNAAFPGESSLLDIASESEIKEAWLSSNKHGHYSSQT